MLRVDVNSAGKGGGGGKGAAADAPGIGSGQWTAPVCTVLSPGVSPYGQQRRQSFLYRADLLDGELSPTRSRLSLKSDSAPFDDFIVTPFAQLIDSLRKVKSNCLMLLKGQLTTRFTASVPSKMEDSGSTSSPNSSASPTDDRRRRIAHETLEELEWCLEQLEFLQNDKSAAQIATNKFKRMLNRELYQFAESDKARTQVSQFISRTFLHKEREDLDPDKRNIGKMHSRSEDSPHAIISPVDLETKGLPSDATRGVVRQNYGAYSPGGRGICSSKQTVPTYGVVTKDEERLAQQMRNLNSWGMDMFILSDAASHRPLTAITYTILQERGLLETFRIPTDTLLNFLHNLENLYRTDIPYHNRLHAADVAQSSHVLLLLPAFRNVFSDLEILATIFAAAVHDVDHPGLNSQFLINSNSDLALLYNDESVLENHHLAVAFRILKKDKCDIFCNLTKNQRQTLRHIVIGTVLATDMSKHMEHLAHLKTMVELRSLSGNSRLEVENQSHRQQILQSLVHCADLSNPTKSWEIYSKWTAQIMEEFFRQGDKEKQLGLDVSPMCDRDTARVASSQVGFIDFVVRPLWETWADLVFPDCQQILDTLVENRQQHQLIIDEEFSAENRNHGSQNA